MEGDTPHHDERTPVDRIRGEVRKESLLLLGHPHATACGWSAGSKPRGAPISCCFFVLVS
jgi:hypothetical protein